MRLKRPLTHPLLPGGGCLFAALKLPPTPSAPNAHTKPYVCSPHSSSVTPSPHHTAHYQPLPSPRRCLGTSAPQRSRPRFPPALQLLPQPYCFTHPASPRLPWRSMLCFPKQEDRLEALLSRLHHPSSLTAQHPASNGITHHIPLPSHLPVKSCLALQESEEKTPLPLLAHAAGTREQTNYPERGHCCQAETH